ncbi:chorismate mutase [Protomyces lactucae-debilis]|uniref:Chorismate mutase n=1 Tax=Protomyces lactucae-debilis TaxID=2754530 RepID=A0A1Y2FNP2_PROLT|nr:chorismate mutase [Protomyces lactucae-debilis]ORY85611.1 chorismate mutase [Protomyces lactucae-debilis]
MDLLAEKPLNLANIRYALIRQEDTIIFKLIERAQFPQNGTIYKPGAIPIKDFDGSFLDFVLEKSEQAHALVRRYQSPDEYAFSSNLPEPIIPPLQYPSLIKADGVSVNHKIKEFYLEKIVPKLCESNVGGDQGERLENYGSAAVCDVECLQALSRRIHFGKFVAEVKFLAEREKYTKMIQEKDIEGLTKGITNAAVEQQVLARLEKKARNYGRDPADLDSAEAPGKVDVETVVRMYENFVIPLTKEVEIEYLLRRLELD